MSFSFNSIIFVNSSRFLYSLLSAKQIIERKWNLPVIAVLTEATEESSTDWKESVIVSSSKGYASP